MLMRRLTFWSSGIVLFIVVLCTVYVRFLSLSTVFRNQQEIIGNSSALQLKNGALIPADSTNEAFITGLEHLPSSFRGTEPDGALQADSHGNLLINQEIRFLFDYFLAGFGEESLEIIQARIRAYIRFHLPDSAATQANHLLDNYLALQTRLSALNRPVSAPNGDLEAIAEQLQMISDIRKSFLSDEVADAFFGEEETYDRFNLDKLKIMRNDQLNMTEKAKQITDLQTQLPETLQRSLSESQQAVNLQQLSQQLLNNGGTSSDLQKLRSEKVGDAAADRLAQLDNARVQRKSKINDWFDARESLLRNPQMSEADKVQVVAQLRSERFNESELRRVEALERIQDNKHE